MFYNSFKCTSSNFAFISILLLIIKPVLYILSSFIKRRVITFEVSTKHNFNLNKEINV